MPPEPEEIAAQRDRLLRLCRRWTGDADAAEDLAQEAVLIALRQSGEGRLPDDWAPWVTGVARMLCRGWRSRRAIAAGRLAPAVDADALPDEDSDPLGGLLSAERSELLDRAFAHLDGPARALLAARYLDDAPLEEVAGKLGVSTNAAAVRLHRAREAAQRVLATRLRADAAAHGLLDTDAAEGWEETRIWCCRCGNAKMLGRFARGAAGAAADFALRCPSCDAPGGYIAGFSSHAAPMRSARVLDGVNGFRTGYNRIQSWWQGYVAAGLAHGRAACVRCGGEAVVDTTARGHDGGTFPGFVARCRACPERFFIAPGGLVFHAPEFGEFWRAHPRLRYLPAREIVCEGQPAVLTGFADRQGSARLEIVFARSDLRRLRLLHSD